MEQIQTKAPLSIQIDPRRFAPAAPEEKRQAEPETTSTTLLKDGIKKLRRNPLAMMSVIVLGLIIAAILLTPAVCPYSATGIIKTDGHRDASAKNLAPFTYSENELAYIARGGRVFPHIFGTDELCRDYFARVIGGTTISLFVGLLASVIVLVIGLIYGSVAGYCGGRIDMLMMRVVDVIYALPDMLIVILLSVALSPITPKVMRGLSLILPGFEGIKRARTLIKVSVLIWCECSYSIF